MLNNGYVGVQTYGDTKQILADVSKQASIGCIVPQGLGVQVGHRKIVRAGTPIHVDPLNPFTPVTAPTSGGGGSDGYRKTILYNPEIHGTQIVVHDFKKLWEGVKGISAFENNNFCGSFVLTYVNPGDASAGFTIMQMYTDDESYMQTITCPVSEDELVLYGAEYDPNGTPSPENMDGFEWYVAPDVDYILAGTAPIVKQNVGNYMYGWDTAFNPYDKTNFPFNELFNTPEEYIEQFKLTKNYRLEFKISQTIAPPHTRVEVSTDSGVVSTGWGAIDPEASFLSKVMFTPFDPTDLQSGRYGILQLAPGKTWEDLYSANEPLWLNIQKKEKNTGGGSGNGESNFNAVLLHDVDVTLGAANGTALLHGIVNLKRLDEATRTEAEKYADVNTNHIKFIMA